MREGIRLIESSPDYTYCIRFEDLTAKPDEVLSALCDFCELPTDTTFREYARQTLHPVPARAQFDIPPKIAPIFLETMEELQYNA